MLEPWGLGAFRASWSSGAFARPYRQFGVGVGFFFESRAVDDSEMQWSCFLVAGLLVTFLVPGLLGEAGCPPGRNPRLVNFNSRHSACYGELDRCS